MVPRTGVVRPLGYRPAMSVFGRFVEVLRRSGVLGGGPASERRKAADGRVRPGGRPAPGRRAAADGRATLAGPGPAPTGTGVRSPGQAGPAATEEIDPHRIGRVRTRYSPSTDGDPDPGEIVWTWVPYEERDGRGKDRPVLIVAAESAGTVLGVALTSRPHEQDGFVPLGAGAWDGEQRPSWANLERVFRVHPAGMRREAAALAAEPFARVVAHLQRRYGWR